MIQYVVISVKWHHLLQYLLYGLDLQVYGINHVMKKKEKKKNCKNT